MTEAFLERPEARRLAERFDARTLVVPESLFDELAVLPAGVGMLAVVGTPKPAMDDAGDFCLLLDDVQDPGNVGSMLRSAAAAGVVAGAPVAALRVRLVAEGAARRHGRAFPALGLRGRRPASVVARVSRARRTGRGDGSRGR